MHVNIGKGSCDLPIEIVDIDCEDASREGAFSGSHSTMADLLAIELVGDDEDNGSINSIE